MTTRLKNYAPDFLAFELLNEPAATYDHQWNTVAAKVISAIREIDTERILVVSANEWASVDHVSAIRVPDNDPNIMLTFHFYEPALLTHFLAAWQVDFKDLQLATGVHYPGDLYTNDDSRKLSIAQKRIVLPYKGNYDKAWMNSRLQNAIAFASSKGRTLLVGEFGCLPSVEHTSRMNWVNDVIDICLENELPRAYWEYKSAFGFCHADGSLKSAELRDALVRKSLSTGINGLSAVGKVGFEDEGSIYTLSGQRIGNSSPPHVGGAGREASMLKGRIYIVNGRKVMIR